MIILEKRIYCSTLILRKIIKQALIAMPDGSEWIILSLVMIPWFLGIRAVLQHEQNATTRMIFTLIAFFVPPFAIIYWLYSKMGKA